MRCAAIGRKGSRCQLQFLTSTPDDSVDSRFGGLGDRDAEPELVRCFREGIGIRSEEFETFEMAASWRVDRGMRCVGAPFNEKRKQAAMIVFEAERFPMKDFAIGTLARTGLRALEFDSFLAQPSSELVQIVAMLGPTDEARLF